MPHWGYEQSHPEVVEAAKKINAALKKHGGPMWEKHLRQVTGLDSIGSYFPLLRAKYGICRVEDWRNRPDDDNKLYLFKRMVKGYEPPDDWRTGF